MIFSLVILVCLISAVHCGKPLDYTPLLKYLDDDIIRDLKDPINGRGKDLIKYLEKYNSRLIDARDMIQQNIYEAFIKAVELQKIGGPQFLKITVNKEQLKDVFKWTEDDFLILQNHFETTKNTWKEVEAEFKPAETRFKQIHEEDAKEKAEQAEREQKRVEQLRKVEEEFSKKVTVNIGKIEHQNLTMPSGEVNQE